MARACQDALRETSNSCQRILGMGEGPKGLNGVCSGLLCQGKGLSQIFCVAASVCVDSAVPREGRTDLMSDVCFR